MASISPQDSLIVNTIRVIGAEMVQKANSGHPGAPMGLAPVAHALFGKIMNYNPTNPNFWNRDRFILSNGHACALLYTMLHLSGYDLSLDDLKAFRTLDSKCPGHPENFKTPGVEVSTGPLGQGIANGVGMAMAEQHLAAVYNKPGHEIINNYTYVVCGDGCLQEGVAVEAVSLAGTQKLNKLIVLYDDNGIQIDGKTDLAFTDDTPKKFEAMGWNVLYVNDGDRDIDGIVKAVEEAKQSTEKPTIIVVKTTIGFAAKKQGTEEVHGSPLGHDDIANVKKVFGLPEESFVIQDPVREFYAQVKQKGEDYESSWKAKWDAYKAAFPQEAQEFEQRMSGHLPADFLKSIPAWGNDAVKACGDKYGKVIDSTKADATRNTSGIVLNAVAPIIQQLMGGSADLTPSNKTWLNCSTNFTPTERSGRYIRFGVREHAMIAIGNGLQAYGGIIPFTATFLNFIEYGFGAVRLSALSGHQHILVMTHDSIGLGEDGPTHQPIEAVNLLRATPNVLTFRPADANEVAGSYAVALQHHGPSVLCLSRQNVSLLPTSTPDIVFKGGYIVQKKQSTGKANVTLVATGSEVDVALSAATVLESSGLYHAIHVVSMPCRELFDEQPREYRQEVLPRDHVIVSVEAASPDGWEKYTHVQVAMHGFGASAPTNKLYDHFGFTGEKVAAYIAENVINDDDMKQFIDKNDWPLLTAQRVKATTKFPSFKQF